MRKTILACLLAIGSVLCAQQTDSMIYVKQFAGSDVGTKVTNAMAACGSNASVPCILVIEPSLATAPAGSLPSLCGHCYLLDWRTGPPTSSGISNTSVTVGTTLIPANSCSSASTVTMAGVSTGSTFQFTPASDPSSTTGWSPGAAGQLYFNAWPTANTLNYKVCNPTTASITPGASTTWNVSAK